MNVIYKYNEVKINENTNNQIKQNIKKLHMNKKNNNFPKHNKDYIDMIQPVSSTGNDDSAIKENHR